MWVDGKQAGTAAGASPIVFYPTYPTYPTLLDHDYIGTGFLGGTRKLAAPSPGNPGCRRSRR